MYDSFDNTYQVLITFLASANDSYRRLCNWSHLFICLSIMTVDYRITSKITWCYD